MHMTHIMKRMKLINRLIRIFLGVVITPTLFCQQLPSEPISYKIFSPVIVNPAFAGTKDFTRLHLISRANGNYDSQMISMHTRLKNKSIAEYPGEISYSNFGIGLYGFHKRLENSRVLGAGLTGSYHIPLGAAKVSGISFGISAHSLYTTIPDDSELSGISGNKLTPGVDAGILLYSPTGYIGISSRNITNLRKSSDIRVNEEVSIINELLLTGGIRLIISRNNAVVLEPSFIASINDSLITNPANNILPAVKVYVQNACFGTILQEMNRPAFFIQYQFPDFYAGVLAGLPGREMVINNNQIRIELSLGLNLGNRSDPDLKHYRW